MKRPTLTCKRKGRKYWYDVRLTCGKWSFTAPTVRVEPVKVWTQEIKLRSLKEGDA